MNCYLIKSEPHKYPWQQLLTDGKTNWDGVRNYSARINLNAMALGDKLLFYHSNEGKEIVGLAAVTKTAFPEPGDDTGKWVSVEVSPLYTFAKPVTLETIKQHPILKHMEMLRLNRLSVSKVTPEELALIEELGNG